MNRRRKLLIPLLFCGAMLTACDDKSAENAAAMTPEVGVVTLSPGSVNVLSELPGRTVPYEVAEIRPQVGGIIIKRNFIEGDKVNQGDSLYQIAFTGRAELRQRFAGESALYRQQCPHHL